MIISERIFNRLSEIKMSQSEFSRQTGISTSTINDWKHKKTNPSADKLICICKVLGISLADLLCEEDDKGSLKQEYITGEKQIIELISNTDMMTQRRIASYFENSLRNFECSFKENAKRNISVIQDADGLEGFSEKSLRALGDFYVYGLIDPIENKFFYIGKGAGNRVFEHEKESINSPDSDKLKLKTISEIKAHRREVKKIIIKSKLTESEAFAAEAALINAFNYIGDVNLTNIIAGHHSTEALSVEEFEKIYGAEELCEDDIKHKILVIKINKLYRRNMPDDELYDAVRGVWRASMNNVRSIEYVFGVYNSLIVAVYKPTKWYICKEAPEKRPRQEEVLTPQIENRIFFVDENFENRFPQDENEIFYCGKSIGRLKLNQGAQNPITYLKPKSSKD